MKKSLKCLIAAGATVISTGAFAASNMENPLYMPKANEGYVKIGAALMGKKVEGTEATNKKETAGNVEIPVWRFTGDLGYGITDRLDIHGRFGYTNDVPINRKGMHRGRLGLMFRALTEKSPIVWDLYADAYLSGLSQMKGEYTLNGFNYENYSNGRWGVIAGTRLGKTFGDFTLAAHVEYLRTFGNHNNKISVDPAVITALSAATAGAVVLPSELSVDLKSTSEWTAGFDMMYQMTQKWSFGAGFEFVQHADNGVKGISTAVSTATSNYLVTNYSDMKDGWNEYVIKINAAYQMNDYLQLTPFFEYTFDTASEQSQNATDYKYEVGVRLNVQF